MAEAAGKALAVSLSLFLQMLVLAIGADLACVATLF